MKENYRNMRVIGLTLIWVAMLLSTVQLSAQTPLKPGGGASWGPSHEVVCPSSGLEEHVHTEFRTPFWQAVAEQGGKMTPEQETEFAGIQTATIVIDFGDGFNLLGTDAQAARDAFRFAADIWETEVVSNVPILIAADFAALPGGVLGQNGSPSLTNVPNAPDPSTNYTLALANAIAGVDLSPGTPNGNQTYNTNFTWYFGTDGNTPAGQTDFVTVVLHEIGHSMGISGISNGGAGVGAGGGANPRSWDLLVELGDGTPILDLGFGTPEQQAALVSNDLFINGPLAVAALGGQRPKIFAPNPFQGGSSFSHWDEATFPSGDPNSLMTPFVGTGVSNFNIGDITRGVLADQGWQLSNDLATQDVGIVAISSPVSDSDLSATQNIEVTVRNFGIDDASGFTISYSIDGGAPITEAFVGTLPSISVATFTFATTADLSADGTSFSIDAFTTLAGDEDTSNDSASATVVNLIPEIQLSATEIDFGSLGVGNEGTGAITVTSVLSGALSGEVDVQDIQIQNASSGIFTSLDTTPITVNPGESADLSFSYSPTALGSDAATAVLTTNAGIFQISLLGQGEEPALIDVTPTSLTSDLEIGEEETQQITITNTGAADLNFSLAFVKSTDGGGTTSVAAPFKGAKKMPSGSALLSRPRSSLNLKSSNDLQSSVIAENSVYVVDDGTSENNIGLNADSELMWMNAFQTAAGAQVITSISSAVASGNPETPARFILYNDPDNDGDPTNAEFLLEVSGVLTNPGEDVFSTVSIPATEVEGVFFIAVLIAEDPTVNAFPMPLDGSSGSQQASWVIGNTADGGFNVLDLTANSLPPVLIDNATPDGSLAGNWLLRADGDFFTASPMSGTLAQGESIDVDVNFSGDVPGTFNSNIVISSNAPNNPEIQIPVTLNVEGVAVTASPSPLIETLDQGRTSTQVLTLSNAGGSDVTFSIAVEDLGIATPVAVASNRGFIPLVKRQSAYSGELYEGSNAIISDGTQSIGAVQFETSFEEFALGDLNGQNGWTGQFANWAVETTNPSDGSQQIRSLSDGLGQTLAFSPEVAIGVDPISSVSLDVELIGTGVTWDIIPQSGTAGSVNTRLRFNPDGSVSALVDDPVAGAIFAPLGINAPSGYFNVRIEVERATSEFAIYFDNELVFEGTGFAGDIEQLVFLSLMEIAGPTMDFDNVKIFDGESGDAGAPAIQVETLAGVVPAGGSVDINVLFDANRDFGTYRSDLVVTLNDNPAIDPLVVEVSLNVIGDPTIAVDPTVVQEISNFNVMSTRTVTIENTGGQPLEYNLDIIGNDIGVTTSEVSDQIALMTATPDNAILDQRVSEKLALDQTMSSLTASDEDAGEIFITIGDVVFAEDFEGGTFPPTGWTTVDNEGNGVEWGFSADVGETNYSGSGEAATVSSDAFGAAEFDAELISPVINVAGKSNLTLKYNVNYQNFAALDFFDLDISTDGGATWVNVLSWNEDHGAFRALPGEAVNIPMDAIIGGADEIMLRWHYYDPNTGDFDWYAQIDDVELVENSEVWLAVDQSSGVVPVGGTAEVELTFDPTVVDPGLYVAGIIVNSNAVNTPVVGVVVSMQELNPAEISVSPDSLSQELVAGRSGSQTLTISNTGESVLDFNFGATFPNVGDAESTTTGTSSEGAIKEKSSGSDINLLSTAAIVAPQSTQVSYSIEAPVEFSNVQYATNFETFGLGDINGQQGWAGQFVNWVISDANPAGGEQHVRSVSDGLGQTLAFTPAVGIGTEPVSSTAMNVDLEGTGVTWQIIPQSPTAGSVITRLSFDPDGTASALVDVNGGEFQTIAADIPEGQFNVAIQVERATNEFTIYFDGVEVFTGTGFAGDIEQVVFLSLMEIADPIMDIDNMQIVDGVIPDPVISTSPMAGSIASGESVDIEVTFNATNLDAGVYNNDLVINNNDPGNNPFAVPTTLTVIGAQVIGIAPDALTDTLEIGEMSIKTLTVSNSGAADLIFDINIVGDLVVPTATHGEETVVNDEWKTDAATLEKLAFDESQSLDLNATQASAVERSATVALVFETFEGGTFPPEGWATIDNEGNGVNWGFSADVGEANYSGSGEAATVSSDRFGSAEFDAELWTPEIDVAGRTGIVLEYDVNYQNFAFLDFLDVDISTDGGATWTTMLSWNEDHGAFRALPGELVSLELDSFIGGADSFIVRWHYYDPNTGDFDWYAQIDNVVIGVPWLTVLNASDTIPGGSSLDIDVKFDASALTPGIYNTNLVVCSDDLRNPQVTVPASLYVLRPPTIEVSPSPIDITLFEEFDTDAAFTIGNSGESDLDYSLSTASGAISITSGGSGVVMPEGTAEAVVNVSAAGLAPGDYQETIEIASNDPNSPTTDLIVNLTVLDFVVLDMELEPTCTDNPEAMRAWTVNNPNTFARDAFWFIIGSDQADSITLEPGENTIYTTTLTDVPNTLKLRWLDGDDVQQEAVSESEGAPCRVRGLILNSICSDNPDVFRAWEIDNRNPFTVSVEWNLVGTDEVGTLSCVPGTSSFFTETVDGENMVKIIWIDEEGGPRRQQKLSDAGACDTDEATTIAFDQGINGSIEAAVTTYPNPFTDRVSVSMKVAPEAEGEYTILVYDIFGGLVFEQITITNFGQLNADISTEKFAKGTYILRLLSNDNESIKMSRILIKE